MRRRGAEAAPAELAEEHAGEARRRAQGAEGAGREVDREAGAAARRSDTEPPPERRTAISSSPSRSRSLIHVRSVPAAENQGKSTTFHIEQDNHSNERGM